MSSATVIPQTRVINISIVDQLDNILAANESRNEIPALSGTGIAVTCLKGSQQHMQPSNADLEAQRNIMATVDSLMPFIPSSREIAKPKAVRKPRVYKKKV